MRISDWSSDVCSSDLHEAVERPEEALQLEYELGDRPVVGGEQVVVLAALTAQLAIAEHQERQERRRQAGHRGDADRRAADLPQDEGTRGADGATAPAGMAVDHSNLERSALPSGAQASRSEARRGGKECVSTY